MVSRMGRPREHDQHTAAALLAAAETAVADGGLEALSVRGVAAEARTTTRAVYSLFGSRDGLIVALGAHAYDLLRSAIEQLPETADPQADLVEAGLVFRRFALEHPSLFSVGIQRTLPQLRALAAIPRRRQRCSGRVEPTPAAPAESGLLGQRTARDATVQFHSLCEGLAAVELRKTFPPGDGERIWREALAALTAGFATTPLRQPPTPTIPNRRPTKRRAS